MNLSSLIRTQIWIDYIVGKLAVTALCLFLVALMSLLIFFGSVMLPGGECPYFILPVFCFPLAFAVSIITLILCFFSSKVFSKSFLIAGITLLLSGFPAFILYGVHLGAQARKEMHKTTGEYRLEMLSVALKEYAKNHAGNLPDPNTWCDQLLVDGQGLTKESFLNPRRERLGLKGECHFAFNANLDGKRLADIPDDVVLLFEADGGWNLNGGAELLSTRYKENGYVAIIFADGSKSDYWFYENAVRKFDSKGTRMFYEKPRWSP